MRKVKVSRTKAFWSDTIVLVSKDENLTKSHARYVECRLVAEAGRNPRWTLGNSQRAGEEGKLPLPDRAAMEEFIDQTKTLMGRLAAIYSARCWVVCRGRDPQSQKYRKTHKERCSLSAAKALRPRWRSVLRVNLWYAEGLVLGVGQRLQSRAGRWRTRGKSPGIQGWLTGLCGADIDPRCSRDVGAGEDHPFGPIAG